MEDEVEDGRLDLMCSYNETQDRDTPSGVLYSTQRVKEFAASKLKRAYHYLPNAVSTRSLYFISFFLFSVSQGLFSQKLFCLKKKRKENNNNNAKHLSKQS